MAVLEINLENLASEILNKVDQTRILVGIAGPPGVGKSTFCDRLCHLLNAHQAGLAAILPMDGFHFDDIYLAQKEWRLRKGAPHTFDVGGLCHMLKRLRDNTEEFVAVPVFDRNLEIARAGARVIAKQTNVILVEGNYLLLDQKPWADLRQFFSISVMLRTDQQILEQRLRARWQRLKMSAEEIEQKLTQNDLPNVKTVLDFSCEPDFVVRTD